MFRPVERRAVEGPRWPLIDDGDEPRVLIEHPDPLARHLLANAFRSRGYSVITCGGPDGAGMDRVACPLLVEGSCAAVDGADVVVSALQVGLGTEGRIVARLVEDPITPPLLLEASAWQLGQVGYGDRVERRYPFRIPDEVVDAADALLPTT